MNRGGQYDVQQKQRIKDMLKDSIRVLCQNTIAHRKQLSIEALIGITVDNGEDIILVNIQEFVGKQLDVGTQQVVFSSGDVGHTDDSAWAADGDDQQVYYENEDNSYTSVDDSAEQHFSSSGLVHHQPFGTVLKEETTSVVTYNTCRSVSHSGGGSSAAVSTKSEMFPSDQNEEYYIADESSYTEQQLGDEYKMPYHGSGAPYTTFPPCKPAIRRHRPPPHRARGGGTALGSRRGAGVRQRPRGATSLSTASVGHPASATIKKNFGSKDEDTPWQPQQQPLSSQGGCVVVDEEVAHVTLYTCSRCGVQMRNRSSFMRHKRSHEGIVYRCDGCGKILSRSDHLVAHRRRCLPAQEQLPVE
jgi:predicted RNA-binding Zn-ribbon protein involved in translation (DUF1610 family)